MAQAQLWDITGRFESEHSNFPLRQARGPAGIRFHQDNVVESRDVSLRGSCTLRRDVSRVREATVAASLKGGPRPRTAPIPQDLPRHCPFGQSRRLDLGPNCALQSNRRRANYVLGSIHPCGLAFNPSAPMPEVLRSKLERSS